MQGIRGAFSEALLYFWWLKVSDLRDYTPLESAFCLLVFQISRFSMDCPDCHRRCHRAGRQKSGVQRYRCWSCRKYRQEIYTYRACQAGTNEAIRSLLCESVGIRGIGRVLGIAAGTVLDRIGRLAKAIERPSIPTDEDRLEVDELWTYIGRKANEHWVAYALNKHRKVVDFVVGQRTVSTLRRLTDRLLASGVKKIRTDRLTHYRRLIPKERHHCSAYGINHIERKNLTLRTHLKRLSRRTICFSRKLAMLENCSRIYFWRGQTA
jgi:insertion element IS1 protein InsB